MPLIKLKRNNINIDTDTTILAHGEGFWNYWNGKSIFVIGDGVNMIKDLPRYETGDASNADRVDGLHAIHISQYDYDSLPMPDENTIYFVE